MEWNRKIAVSIIKNQKFFDAFAKSLRTWLRYKHFRITDWYEDFSHDLITFYFMDSFIEFYFNWTDDFLVIKLNIDDMEKNEWEVSKAEYESQHFPQELAAEVVDGIYDYYDSLARSGSRKENFVYISGYGADRWAKQNWDTYGFDYEFPSHNSVTIFSVENLDEVTQALDEEGLEYDVKEEDLKEHYGWTSEEDEKLWNQIRRKKTASLFRYVVKATGYGYGFTRYPMEIEFTTSQDKDKDEYSAERVAEIARKKIRDKGAFREGQFKILSIDKVDDGKGKWMNRNTPSGIRHY